MKNLATPVVHLSDELVSHFKFLLFNCSFRRSVTIQNSAGLIEFLSAGHNLSDNFALSRSFWRTATALLIVSRRSRL